MASQREKIAPTMCLHLEPVRRLLNAMQTGRPCAAKGGCASQLQLVANTYREGEHFVGLCKRSRHHSDMGVRRWSTAMELTHKCVLGEDGMLAESRPGLRHLIPLAIYNALKCMRIC